MCGVVFDFGSACMDCGKTGEVGTDDLRKRDPSGGRGDSREALDVYKRQVAIRTAEPIAKVVSHTVIASPSEETETAIAMTITK